MFEGSLNETLPGLKRPNCALARRGERTGTVFVNEWLDDDGVWPRGRERWPTTPRSVTLRLSAAANMNRPGPRPQGCDNPTRRLVLCIRGDAAVTLAGRLRECQPNSSSLGTRRNASRRCIYSERCVEQAVSLVCQLAVGAYAMLALAVLAAPEMVAGRCGLLDRTTAAWSAMVATNVRGWRWQHRAPCRREGA
jgi:hypothetical protein